MLKVTRLVENRRCQRREASSSVSKTTTRSLKVRSVCLRRAVNFKADRSHRSRGKDKAEGVTLRDMREVSPLGPAPPAQALRLPKSPVLYFRPPKSHASPRLTTSGKPPYLSTQQNHFSCVPWVVATPGHTFGVGLHLSRRANS